MSSKLSDSKTTFCKKRDQANKITYLKVIAFVVRLKEAKMCLAILETSLPL